MLAFVAFVFTALSEFEIIFDTCFQYEIWADLPGSMTQIKNTIEIQTVARFHLQRKRAKKLSSGQFKLLNRTTRLIGLCFRPSECPHRNKETNKQTGKLDDKQTLKQTKAKTS